MNLFYVLILLRIMTINGVIRSEVPILVMKIPKFSLLLISKPVKIIANVENTKIDEENILICVTIAIALNKKQHDRNATSTDKKSIKMAQQIEPSVKTFNFWSDSSAT